MTKTHSLRDSYQLYSAVKSLEDGEALFNDMFLFLYFKAISMASATGAPQFKVGETRLRAMQKKVNDPIDAEDIAMYKADGIVSLYA